VRSNGQASRVARSTPTRFPLQLHALAYNPGTQPPFRAERTGRHALSLANGRESPAAARKARSWGNPGLFDRQRVYGGDAPVITSAREPTSQGYERKLVRAPRLRAPIGDTMTNFTRIPGIRSAAFCAAALVFTTSPALAITASQLGQMTAAQKLQAQKYFNANSLSFSPIFKRYHPGPYWILQERVAFRLTSAQIHEQEQLKNQMAVVTITDGLALRQAYARYARDAAVAHPTVSTMKSDVETIGKAQTRLAWEMVPYHLKAYALLTAAQKSMYPGLAASTWASKQASGSHR
jgi:hypothetical protein